MAHLLNCERLSVSLADRVLLDNVSVGVDDGDRIGVVGRNGDGKSTLLRLLVGGAQPDSGRVSLSGGLRVGFLTQTDSFADDVSVRCAVVGDAPEHEWLADARVRDVLSGLLGDIERDVPGGFDALVGHLSGGQRRRVALAATLVGEHDLLVLDEPTNHLDVEGVAWLAQHLKGRWPSGKGGLLLVTHDRWFLDAVCTSTWEVQGGSVHAREGGYAAFVLARAERDRVAEATAARTANLVRKELAWLRRGAPARTSKPKFRVDAATELIKREPDPRDTVELVRTATARLGKDVFDVEGVTFAVPGENGRVLFDDITWRIGPGDRFGVVGTNGAGKTTLLKLLTGVLAPDSGRVKRGKTVQLAILSQDLRELDEVADSRAVDAVTDVRAYVMINGKETSAAQLVERLGFTKQRSWVPVRDLSGGERRRLQLARLLIQEPNVLILDEPTNDLDTDTLAAMEDVLDSFGGTLLVVSHDRYLLERIADRLVGVLGDGTLRDLPRGVAEYLELKAAAARQAAVADVPVSQPRSSGVSGAALRAAEKDAARWERKVASVQQKIDALMVDMAACGADIDQMLVLEAQRAQLSEQLAEAEEAWLAALEVLEG